MERRRFTGTDIFEKIFDNTRASFCPIKGLEKMKAQCLFTAVAYNIKEIATILGGYFNAYLNLCCNINKIFIFS